MKTLIRTIEISLIAIIMAVCFVGFLDDAQADPPVIYGQDGQYLGKLSNNPYDLDSISNPYGLYGSKYSNYSINNPYGKYGSEYSYQSPYGGNTTNNKITMPIYNDSEQ